jgi:hypothetical protein
MDRIYETAIDVDHTKGPKLPCCTLVWLTLIGAFALPASEAGPGTHFWKLGNLDGTSDPWSGIRAAKQVGAADQVWFDLVTFEAGRWYDAQVWTRLEDGDVIGEKSRGHNFLVYALESGGPEARVLVLESDENDGLALPRWPPEEGDGVPFAKVVKSWQRFALARLRVHEVGTGARLEVATPATPPPPKAGEPDIESGSKLDLRAVLPIVGKFVRSAEQVFDGPRRGREKKSWVLDQVLKYANVPIKERKALLLVIDAAVAFLLHRVL